MSPLAKRLFLLWLLVGASSGESCEGNVCAKDDDDTRSMEVSMLQSRGVKEHAPAAMNRTGSPPCSFDKPSVYPCNCEVRAYGGKDTKECIDAGVGPTTIADYHIQHDGDCYIYENEFKAYYPLYCYSGVGWNNQCR